MLSELFDRLDKSIGAGADISTLRTQLHAIRDQVEAIEAELQETKTQLQEAQDRIKNFEAQAQTKNLAPNPDELEEGAVKILRLLFEGAELSAQQMAASLGMTKGMAEYHCGVLSEKQMVFAATIGFVMDFGDEPTPTTWVITTKGRQYLVKNKLVA